MPESILVVEYEPRYTERVRQALLAQPWEAQFARDGEEALRMLESMRPSLIVLSSVTPKVSTGELIRRIRGNQELAATPILLTVSGYSGSNPRGDAAKAGATDILPKPYTEQDFASRVQQILAPEDTGGFTSREIFGELLDDEPARPAQKVRNTATANVDDLLADTLSGVLPRKTNPGTMKTPPVEQKKGVSGADLATLLEQTLSGVDKRRVAPPPPANETPASAPVARAEEPVPPAPAAAVSTSAPVPPPAQPAPAKSVEDEDPSDGTRFGQYVLQDRIAAGGMAEVWKARMRGVEGFQKTVAIKKILPHLSDNDDFIEMFIDEAKLAAQLSHNNIIHIYDLGKATNAYYIAMEYIDGHDLRSILRASGERGMPLPVETSLFIASKIAAALDYAHRKRDFDDKELGLVHRDVSPQNVLISYEGDIKLCDFGIAKAASKASHTQAGALKGKLQYMSPEQAWGRSLDGRSDVFALGVVLFEMLTGRKLFVGDTEMSVLEQVREAKIPSLVDLNEDITPDIEAILMRALQKQPEDRYQSAGEMARDLDQILYGFRPTPTSADVAIYMHRLYDESSAGFPVASAPMPEQDEPKNRFESLTSPAILDIPDSPLPEPEPEPEPRPLAPVVAPVAAAPVAAAAVPAESHTAAASPFGSSVVVEEAPRRKTGLIIGIAAALLLAASAAAFFVFRPAPATTAQQASLTPVPSATPAVAEPAPIVLPPVEVIEEQVASDLETDDQQAIDQEVQRRLAEAREQLEAQRRAQLAEQQRQLEATRQADASKAAAAQRASSQPADTPPPAATKAPEPAATQPSQPQPAVAETRPVVTPPATTTQQQSPPQQAQQAPAPVPAPARTQVGDLVAPGTAGLVAPEVVKMPQPTYPPMARARRLEGTVLLNVLVSETGNVMDVRVLRGISPDLGFTNSATEAARAATFRPATKDGVRVKTYKTISVSFKL